MLLVILMVLLLPKRPYAYTTHISTHNLLFRTQELCKFSIITQQPNKRAKKKSHRNRTKSYQCPAKKSNTHAPLFYSYISPYLNWSGYVFYALSYVSYRFSLSFDCFTWFSENCVCATQRISKYISSKWTEALGKRDRITFAIFLNEKKAGGKFSNLYKM